MGVVESSGEVREEESHIRDRLRSQSHRRGKEEKRCNEEDDGAQSEPKRKPKHKKGGYDSVLGSSLCLGALDGRRAIYLREYKAKAKSSSLHKMDPWRVVGAP